MHNTQVFYLVGQQMECSFSPCIYTHTNTHTHTHTHTHNAHMLYFPQDAPRQWVHSEATKMGHFAWHENFSQKSHGSFVPLTGPRLSQNCLAVEALSYTLLLLVPGIRSSSQSEGSPCLLCPLPPFLYVFLLSKSIAHIISSASWKT